MNDLTPGQIKYRIAWASKTTHATGHGELQPEIELSNLRAWQTEMNRKYPDIIHYLQRSADGSEPHLFMGGF